jgi:hypothetical protein
MSYQSGQVRLALWALGSIAAVGCEALTDHSAAVFVTVEAAGKPFRAGGGAVLVRGNRMGVTARAWRRTGSADSVEVPNVEIRWSSSSTADATVLPLDNRSAEITGIRSTAVPVEITAVAIGFQEAVPGITDVRIADLLEVDSIRPRQVRFGQQVTLYGVGIDAIGFATLGGGQLIADTATFQGHRGGLGRMRFWVPPPSTSGQVLAVGPGVFVAAPESTVVESRDLYEPNDSTPWVIRLDGPDPRPGQPALRVFNPALAFEALRTDTVGYDWYRFTTATSATPYTIVVDPPGGGGGNRTLIGSANNQAGPPRQWNWATGPGLQICKGTAFSPRSVPQDQLIFAFKRLPAGAIDLFIEYLIAGPYALAVIQGYLTVDPSIGPDRFEENDICDLADQNFGVAGLRIDLTTPFADTLTIDNPGDTDWFRFRVPGPGPQKVTVKAGAPNKVVPVDFKADLADLGVFLLTTGPTVQVIAAQQTRNQNNEAITMDLPAGEYYLVVIDQGGAPTRYGLCLALGSSCLVPAVAGSPAATATRWVDQLLGSVPRPRRPAGPRPVDRVRAR